MYIIAPDSIEGISVRAIVLADAALLTEVHPAVIRSLRHEKAKSLMNLANAKGLRGDLVGSLTATDSAASLFEQLGSVEGMADAHGAMGVLYGRMSRYDDQRTHLSKAITIYERDSLLLKLVYCLANMGEYYMNTGSSDSAVSILRHSVDLAEAVRDQAAIATAQLTLGYVLSEMGHIVDAVDEYEDALEVYVRSKDQNGQAMCLNNIAKVYDQQGLLNEAGLYFRRSLKLCKSIGDKYGEAIVRSNIGNIYMRLHEYRRAAEEFGIGANLCKEIGNRKDEAIQTGHLGSALIAAGDTVAGLRYLRISRFIADDIGNPTVQGHALMRLGDAMKAKGRNDSALYYLSNAAVKYKRNEVLDRYALILSRIATIHLLEGRNRQAARYAKEAVLASVSCGVPEAKLEALRVNFETLKAQGNTRRAYECLRELDRINEIMWSNQAKIAFVKAELQHGFLTRAALKARKRIILADDLKVKVQTEKMETDNRRLVFIEISSLAGILLFVSAVFVVSSWSGQRNKRLRELDRLKLSVWRTQVNPHFVHTALQSINSYLQASQRDLASTFLTRFARLMRAVLENVRKDEVSLASDLALMRDYLELEKIRSNAGFQYEIVVDPSIDMEEVMVPPMLLQPFAEEAIWKRLAHKDEIGHLTVRAQQQGSGLLLSLEDDGTIEQLNAEAHYSSDDVDGTTITRSRLDLLAQREGKEASVQLIPLATGQRVELTVPLLSAA